MSKFSTTRNTLLNVAALSCLTNPLAFSEQQPFDNLTFSPVQTLVKDTSPGASMRIDMEKVDPARLLLDTYSPWAKPYNQYYFHNMDKLGLKVDLVRRGSKSYALKKSAEDLTLSYSFRGETRSLDEFLVRNNTMGFIVLHKNEIIKETYFHGAHRGSRFISMSMAKSIVATMIGVAISEGKIKSIEDPVDKYLPELSLSGFHGVTIKNLRNRSRIKKG